MSWIESSLKFDDINLSVKKNRLFFVLTFFFEWRKDRCKNWMTSNFWQISIDSMTFKKTLLFFPFFDFEMKFVDFLKSGIFIFVSNSHRFLHRLFFPHFARTKNEIIFRVAMNSIFLEHHDSVALNKNSFQLFLSSFQRWRGRWSSLYREAALDFYFFSLAVHPNADKL